MPYSKEYVLQPRMIKKPPFSIERPGYEPVKGETIPRTHLEAKDGLISKPAEDVSTVWENLRRAAEKYGNAKAVGSRNLIRTHVETKKVKKLVDGKEQEVDKDWTYFELSEYHYISFSEYEKMSLQCASGLRKLGMEKDDRLLLFAGTRYDDRCLPLIPLSCHFFQKNPSNFILVKCKLAVYGACSLLPVDADCDGL